MLKTFTDLLSIAPDFSLQDIPGFPYDEFQKRETKYLEAERWFTGDALNDQPASTGAKADLYPTRINPIPATVLKHGYVLFGEVEDDGKALVTPRLIPQTEEQKKLATYAEEMINMIWWENNGRAIQMENAIVSQIYGGCVFKLTYVPWESAVYQGGWRQVPIRVSRLNPKHFYGIPDADDMYRLREAWYVKNIDYREARDLGVSADENDKLLYHEHWTKNAYTVMVNNQVARKRVGGEWLDLGGGNPFGFVPFVYIPHLRASGFWGFNVYDHLVGIVKELNLRYGDYGDAINDDAHPNIAMRNVSGSPVIQKVTAWLEAINLGNRNGLTANEGDPDMFQVGTSRASPAMADILERLYGQYERDAYIPPVAYGEDEGSQRSGQTLAIRFWPLTSHCSTERHFWTPGLDVLHMYMLRMMMVKKLNGITKDHLAMRIKERWAPLIPRDREADVQEWQLRSTSDLGSPQHLLELTGDVEDPEEEVQKMLDWKRAVAEIESEMDMKLEEIRLEAQKEMAKMRPQSPPGGEPSNGSSGGNR